MVHAASKPHHAALQLLLHKRLDVVKVLKKRQQQQQQRIKNVYKHVKKEEEELQFSMSRPEAAVPAQRDGMQEEVVGGGIAAER